MKKLIIWASGTETGGGSGFQRLVEYDREHGIGATIAAVISNHPNGGVAKRAAELNIPFHYFERPWTPERYREIVHRYQGDYNALSGWLRNAGGLDPQVTFNIHPGPLPAYGGRGMYGHHVHEKVIEDFTRGLITQSAITMHFVTDGYDEGPAFFRWQVIIKREDTADDLAKRANNEEHRWQATITKLVVTGEISWDGRNPDSLVLPEWLEEMRHA